MNWTPLQNSLVVSGFATLLSASIGFVAALWLVALGPVWRNRLLAAAAVAFVLPPFLVTNCWLYYLGLTGVWRSWLPLNIYSLGGTVWILALLTWPISLLATLSSWQRLESAQLESDPALEGAALIRWLLWPMARVSLGQGAVLTFVLALNNFAVPAILQVKVFPAEVWVKFSTNFDSAGALALGRPLLIAPILLLLLLHRAEINWPRERGGVAPRTIRRQLGPRWFWGCASISIAVLLLSVALPAIQILGVTRTWVELPKVFRAVPGVIWNSFAFSALAALACMLIALAGNSAQPLKAWPCSRRGEEVSATFLRGKIRLLTSAATSLVGKCSHLTGLLLWLPLLTPGVLLGISLIGVFNRPMFDEIYHGAGIVLIAWTIRYLALGWNGVAFALQSVDRDLTDAARLSGASGWALLRHVHWPQIAPQLGAVWYLTYLLCLWDVETLILIYPPGGETLALRIFNLLHYGHNAQVNALCLLLLVLAVMPLVVWNLWRWIAARGNDRLSMTNDQFPMTKGSPNGERESVVSSQLPVSKNQRRLSALTIDARPLPARLGVRSLVIGHWSLVIGHWSLVIGRRSAVIAQRSLLIGHFLLAGCAPKGSDSSTLTSKLFSQVQIIGTRGTAPGQFNKPRSVAVDRNDDLFVVDMTGRVQKFSPAGVFLSSWQMPETDKGKPKGMCRDAQGNIVVLEPHYSRVNHFTPDGELLVQWGTHGTNAGELALPRSVAVDPRGSIFVSEYGLTERVQCFSAEGKQLLRVIGREGAGDGEFNRAEGLGLDLAGRLYVADSCNHRIQVFSPEGNWLRSYGRAGAGPGQMSYPYDVRVDAAGCQIVCEFGNSRIQIFDAQDQPLEILGGAGSAPGRFSNPWGIALDSHGNLYVADGGNHRVQKFIRKKSVVSSQWSVANSKTIRSAALLPRTNRLKPALQQLLTIDY